MTSTAKGGESMRYKEIENYPWITEADGEKEVVKAKVVSFRGEETLLIDITCEVPEIRIKKGLWELHPGGISCKRTNEERLEQAGMGELQPGTGATQLRKRGDHTGRSCHHRGFYRPEDGAIYAVA